MSKRQKTSKTKTSEYNYLEEAKHNKDLAQQWLETVFPEMSQFMDMLEKFNIDMDDVVDMVYNLRAVKRHGYGNVQISVFNGRLTKIESVLRTIKETEISKTLPKVRV